VNGARVMVGLLNFFTALIALAFLLVATRGLLAGAPPKPQHM
jgi:hypothetical protein